MKKTTLVIMAAGIGSRFGGGIKQLTSFGPNGEIIMDYSVYDAIEAGFDKIVFVIRKELETDFKEIIGKRIEKEIEVAYAFQELWDIPQGFEIPAGRTKPWGTGQAILACKDLIQEPFAVINADDYYGKEAFRRVHDYLVSADDAGEKFTFCMAGFVLKNTLSENGGVTRGICRLDEDKNLIAIKETKNIMKTETGAAVLESDGTCRTLDPEDLVSMNFWGFTPGFMEELERGFAEFLKNRTEEDCLTAEYLLPTIVDQLLQEEKVEVTVLKSSDKWFGVTYREDVPTVIADFKKLLEEGVYPPKLWDGQ